MPPPLYPRFEPNFKASFLFQFQRAFYDLLSPACFFCPGFLKCLLRSGSTRGRQVNGAPRGEFESSDDMATYPGIMMTTTTVAPIGRGHSNLTSTRNSPEGDVIPGGNEINSSLTHKVPNGIHAEGITKDEKWFY